MSIDYKQVAQKRYKHAWAYFCPLFERKDQHTSPQPTISAAKSATEDVRPSTKDCKYSSIPEKAATTSSVMVIKLATFMPEFVL
jgi:hypothetical protein